MFTGIVEEVGTVVAVDRSQDARLTLRGPVVTDGVRDGDSIAVDGVCLTVTSSGGDGVFTADVMPETLRRTTLGGLEPGAPVNLERAVRADGRLDGHLVQGHVDGVGELVSRTPGARWDDLEIRLPRELARYVAEKGSVTVSGVSLTVTHVGDDTFGVSLIPTTLDATTLGRLRPGDPVNLEVDVVAKYVERLLGSEGRR
ncbi:riboflavin synthase [Cellulomonas carbonis]|uniref:Riboflavin synthase n=1 Tax=Cellulomonas carbonis T26 TaxID=947969 RepID=A0A0A0BUS1_9CELL|nr:riboflavin synthase [Cellulomonas carbonis]KGM11710.1 riboflavin synthase subunit alpha [Cellulomonas carbonis T26]GGB94381.1 riboflavin synthase subunit alpha [Cellulomonas carbonis]